MEEMKNLYIYHHGIQGQKWGVRRYQNPDGSLTSAGRLRYEDSNRRQVKAINSIYRHVDEQGRRYVTNTSKSPRKFTTVKEHKDYAIKSFIAYDNKKPVSVMTAWKHKNNETEISIMTRKDYQGKGYGSKVVQEGMRWLESSGIKDAVWSPNVTNTASIEMAKKNGFDFVESIGSTVIYERRFNNRG